MYSYFWKIFKNRGTVWSYFWKKFDQMVKVAQIRRCTGCEKISLTVVFSGNPNNIKIGTDSVVRDRCMIRFKHGKIVIGNNVVISHNVTLLAGEHNYSQKKITINNQGIFEAKLLLKMMYGLVRMLLC